MVKKVEYSRGINQCYLLITAEEGSEIEKDCIEMFRYNEIPYFLKFHTQKKDDAVQFFYNITGMQPLEQALGYQSLNYQFVKKILESFDQACAQAENYMLSENDIVLLPELLYLNAESSRFLYCYLPGNRIHICVQFKKFMEYLMRHLDHKDKQAVQLVYGVYQQVAEEKSALHSALKNAENAWEQILCDDAQSSLQENDLPEKNGTIEKNDIIKSDKNIKNNHSVQNSDPDPVQGSNALQNHDLKKYDKKGSNEKKAGKQKESRKYVDRKFMEKKFLNFFRKKIYTDRYRKMEDEAFFETEPEETVMDAYTAPDTTAMQKPVRLSGDGSKQGFCKKGTW